MTMERDITSESPGGGRLWLLAIGTYLLFVFTAESVRFVVTRPLSPLIMGLTVTGGLAAWFSWLTHLRLLATTSRRTITRIALTIAFLAAVHLLNCLQHAGSLLGFWGMDHGRITWFDVQMHVVLGAVFLAWSVVIYQTGRARP